MELSLEDLFAEPPPKVTDHEVSSNQSACLEKVEDTRADFHGNKSTSQECGYIEAEKSNEPKLKKYHVPKLEDILGLPSSHTNKKSKQSFDDKYEFFKETVNESPTGIFNSNEREFSKIKDIGETFKDQFKHKSSAICRTPANCNGGTFKRKPEGDGNGSANVNHEVTPAGNITQGAGQPVSKKRKAGNYQRKLHTKCRVGAKEIRKLVNEQDQDNCDFFWEMPNSLAERPLDVGNNNGESCHGYDIINSGSKFFRQMTGINAEKKTGKQKSKKKKKGKKGKYGLDEVKDSVMYDNDGVMYKDDNILPPRKDLKPHKWPVCKQTSKTEDETKSTNELSYVNVNEIIINGKIHERKSIDIQNSVLDSILQDASYFTGSVNRKDDNIGEVSIENSSPACDSKYISSEKGRNEDAHLKDGCLGSGVAAVKWYEEANQRTPVLSTGGTKVDDKWTIRGKDERAIVYKNQLVNDRSDICGGKKSNKNFDDDDIDGGKSSNDDGYNNEAMHCKNATYAQNKKTQIHPARNHNGSLLSNVTDLPVDLSIVGQVARQVLSVRRKRGGRKKKSKKKQKFNVESKVKVGAKEVKVLCNFFLEGKCSKGADCQFLHKGVPRRRELCRYYVTDSCLADECIFMHSEFPCKFFHGFSKCANGSTCKYSHEPLNKETRKLLDELLARDAALKIERTPQPSKEKIDTPMAELPCNKDTDQTILSLYSSLI